MIKEFTNYLLKHRLKHYHCKLALGIYSLKKNVQLELESHVRIGPAKLDGEHISINAHTYIRSESEIIGNCSIGRFCSIGQKVVIGLQQNMHPTSWLTTSLFTVELERAYEASDSPTKIGNDCWIGRDAIIMSGVTIGDGAIVGARALVTKDVPPYAIVVGVPARVVKYRFSSQLIEAIQSSQWWNLEAEYLGKLDLSNPENCLASLVEGPRASYPRLHVSRKGVVNVS